MGSLTHRNSQNGMLGNPAPRDISSEFVECLAVPQGQKIGNSKVKEC